MRYRLRPCYPYGAEKDQENFCARGSISSIRLLSTLVPVSVGTPGPCPPEPQGGESQLVAMVQRDEQCGPGTEGQWGMACH